MDEDYQKKMNDQDLKRYCLDLALRSTEGNYSDIEPMIEEAKKIYSFITE